MNKIHALIIHLLCLPIYTYQVILYFIDQVAEVNRKQSDKTFLRRIRMTPEEFDEFMKYKQSKR